MRPRLSVALAVIGVSIIACKEVEFPVPAGEQFQAALSGANQVPAVTTTATGSAVFAVSLDTHLTFRINVAVIDTPTVTYIQEGAAGVAGQTLVTLQAATRNVVGYTGPHGQGQVVPSQLQLPAGFGATPRARFDSLLALMRTGGVYVNVRSRRNPNGELRGQVTR